MSEEIKPCPFCEALTSLQETFGPPLMCEKHLLEEMEKDNKSWEGKR